MATAPILPLAWKLPYATGVALKRQKGKKVVIKSTAFSAFSSNLFAMVFQVPLFIYLFLGPHSWLMEFPRLGDESEL